MHLEPRPYQIEAREAIINEWNNDKQKTLLVLPTGCHALGETLFMYNRTIKPVELINIGDKLLGPDGTARNVLYKHNGTANLYKITPENKASFIVTEDHKLTIFNTAHQKNEAIMRYSYLMNSLGIPDLVSDISVKDLYANNNSTDYCLMRMAATNCKVCEFMSFTIEPVGIGSYIGFTVDGDNRYLLSNGIVTHNCGKTIVFTDLLKHVMTDGKKALVLAHTGELLDQAIAKIEKFSDLSTSLEKASKTAVGSDKPIVIASIQTLSRDKRLTNFTSDYFDYIIIDEAHHAMSSSYQKVLKYFSSAKVLGVTATPNRGDQKKLSEYFDSKAYEYEFKQAIKDGYLCPIKTTTVSLNIDLSNVKMQNGDFAAGDVGDTLERYLEQIADVIKEKCSKRKTVVFLPLVATSQKFCDILNSKGVPAIEINGKSKDRDNILSDFEAGKYKVLCNAMLLTEGWDCPAVDCIIVLRPTKSDALYRQMCGRGCRLAPGKKNLLLLDFLWLSKKHNLMHPANLVGTSDELIERMTKKAKKHCGSEYDLFSLEEESERDRQNDIERKLKEELKLAAERKARLDRNKNSLKFVREIGAFFKEPDLINYKHRWEWERLPATEKQIKAIQKFGFDDSQVKWLTKGCATALMNYLVLRRKLKLCTYKQAKYLKKCGVGDATKYSFDGASAQIDKIIKKKKKSA